MPLLLAVLFIGRTFAEPNEVVVISPHWDGIKEETSRAFSAWHEKTFGQPATIRWREAGGGTSQILRFLRAEYQASPTCGVDVLYGGGVDPYIELAKDGLLTPYNPPADVLAAIPAQLNGMALMDPNHQWFGAALTGFGIITNERVREAVGLPEVHAWSDLTDPRLQGWISGIDPRASGSVLTIYEIILQAYGWDKGWAVLMEMSGNTRSFLASAASSAVEVGMGDAAYGVAIDSYGEAQSGYYGPENVSFLLPAGQTMIDPDSIGILKNPPHPEIAEHFLEFVLSRAGQSLWMLPKGAPGGATRNIINRMSVMPALYDEYAATTPTLNNPFKMHSDFVLLERARLPAARDLEYPHRRDNDRYARRPRPGLEGAPLAAMQKLSPERQQALLAQSRRRLYRKRNFCTSPIPTGRIRCSARPWSMPGKARRSTGTKVFSRRSVRTDLARLKSTLFLT